MISSPRSKNSIKNFPVVSLVPVERGVLKNTLSVSERNKLDLSYFSNILLPLIRIMYLSLTHITYSYSEIPVLEDISLSVEKGEWIAIYGVSGSGKTTLLKILGTLIRARTGMYEIADKNMYSLSM